MRETQVNFSFMDDTPGSEKDIVVLYVQVDLSGEAKVLVEKGRVYLLLWDEYIKYSNGLMFSATADLSAGIAQLMAERKMRGRK